MKKFITRWYNNREAADKVSQKLRDAGIKVGAVEKQSGGFWGTELVVANTRSVKKFNQISSILDGKL